MWNSNLTEFPWLVAQFNYEQACFLSEFVQKKFVYRSEITSLELVAVDFFRKIFSDGQCVKSSWRWFIGTGEIGCTMGFIETFNINDS